MPSKINEWKAAVVITTIDQKNGSFVRVADHRRPDKSYKTRLFPGYFASTAGLNGEMVRARIWNQ